MANKIIPKISQVTAEIEVIEDIIEVGGAEEDVSINLEAEELSVTRTRTGRAVKRLRGY